MAAQLTFLGTWETVTSEPVVHDPSPPSPSPPLVPVDPRQVWLLDGPHSLRLEAELACERLERWDDPRVAHKPMCWQMGCRLAANNHPRRQLVNRELQRPAPLLPLLVIVVEVPTVFMTPDRSVFFTIRRVAASYGQDLPGRQCQQPDCRIGTEPK